MIRYALRCPHGHVFDSWFRSADDYERLSADGRLSCAICGADGAAKALMAPTVAAGAPAPGQEAPEAAADGSESAAAPAAAAADPIPAGLLSAPGHSLEAALRAFRARVEATSEPVGRDFARLARAMHEGETEFRAIRGEATAEEARELIDDGVPVAPLPWRTRRND